jgi:hypothetical protein
MSSQRERLKRVLEDGAPHRSDELLRVVYGSDHLGLARLAARVYDLKKTLPVGVGVKSWRDSDHPTLTWYRMGIKL